MNLKKKTGKIGRPVCEYPYCENKVKQNKTKSGKKVFTRYCTPHLKNTLMDFIS